MREKTTIREKGHLLKRGALKHLILTLLLFIPTILSPFQHAHAMEARYLVLIQLDDKWVAYDRLVEITPSGNVMLNAKQFANAMGFSYKKDTKKNQVTISKSKKKYNLYTIDKKKYTQYSNGLPVKEKNASHPASKGNNTSEIFIESNTINNLCYHKMFVGDDINEYRKIGYDAVLCFSTSAKITDIPKFNAMDPEGPNQYFIYSNLPLFPGSETDATSDEENQIENQVINTTALKNRVVEYALEAKGTPYKYDGNDLSKGVDTSGFVQAIYKKIGYNLPKSSKDQLTVGYIVSIDYIRPGDLVFYGDEEKKLVNHVGIYIGDGKIIHAKNKKEGVTISDMYYKKPYYIVKIFLE